MTAPLLSRGKYQARFAENDADVAAALVLRDRCFGTSNAAQTTPPDPFDAKCRHVLVEHLVTGQLVCCFRLQVVAGATAIAQSYSAQYYDLSTLSRCAGPMVELGRFCTEPGLRDPDILRVAWGALTGVVDQHGATTLFGCSSFAGTDPEKYGAAFDLLATRHQAPDLWRPGVKAPEVVRFAQPAACDRKRALSQMPSLLRTYLLMGGLVSDHAVIDRDLGTLHVFTGVEIAAIPAARAKALRAVAR